MRWRWKRTKRSVSLADVSSRIRGFLLDSQINDAHDLALTLGCSPISDEVALMEEDESDRRVAEVGILTPLLYSYAHALAEATIEHQKDSASPEMDKVPKEVWDYSRKLIEQVAISVLIGAVSQMVDMKLLNLPKKLRRIVR